jgi:hypothetical protein
MPQFPRALCLPLAVIVLAAEGAAQAPLRESITVTASTFPVPFENLSSNVTFLSSDRQGLVKPAWDFTSQTFCRTHGDYSL